MAGVTSNGRACRRVGALLGAVMVLATASPEAYAQSGPAQASAQTAGTYRFNIPTKPLASAIADIGAVSGWRIAYPFTVPANLTSRPVAGVMTPTQALDRALAGSGLSYRTAGPQSIVLIDAKQGAATAGAAVAGAVPLETIDVQGDLQSPYGPGLGFIATHSVSATKTDTPILVTPQSISVVTPAQIQAQGAQTVDQALNYTPGIEAQSRGALTGYDFVYSRGFVLDRYLDGLKLQGSNGFVPPQVDIYNLERIDVLSGPASVLYGQASPGGLVDMISKRPTDQPFHEVDFWGGNFDQLEGAFDVGGPIDKDGHFLYRLTGLAESANPQVDFTKSQRISISPSLTIKPDGDTKLTILTNFQRDPWAGPYNFVPATGTLLPNPNGKLPTSFYSGDPNLNTNDRSQYNAGYEFEHRLNDVFTVRQNLRYMYTTGTLNQVLPLDMLDDQTMERYAQTDYETLGAFTVDNQVQAKFSTGPVQHTVLAGLDYQRTDFYERLGQGLAPDLDIFAPVYYQSIPIPDPVSDARQITDQLGVYAQEQAQFGGFHLTLGGREDWVSNQTNDAVAETSSNQFDRHFSWRAGLVYLFDNGIAPYASYTTSFQPQIGTMANGQAFVPTTGQQYEAGVKYQPPGMNSFFTAAIYQLTEQNVPTVDPDNPVFEIQTGEIRSRGVEFSAHANLAPGFNVIASYGYANPIVTQSTTAADIGKLPINVPRNLASLWANYTVQEGAFAGVGLGGGVRYVGYTFGDDENTLKVPPYTLFDAALSYDLSKLRPGLKGLTASLNVKNLADRTYVSECTNEANCLYGLRRTVLFNLRYQW
jgi:iron complex outermembrane receptor protein